jgi:hypothetical protein
MDKSTLIREATRSGACPFCHKRLPDNPVGSGSRRDGLFCNLDCQAAFHAEYFQARAASSRPSSN